MARSRSRTLATANANFDWTSNSNGALLSRTSYNVLHKSESLVDNPTVGYHKKISNGEIIIGDMTATKLFHSTSVSGMSYVNGTDHQTGYGPGILRYDGDRTPNASAAAVGLGSMSTKSRDLAIIQAHANIAKPDVQAIVSAAELGKTIDMLRNPFSGLRDWTRRLHTAGYSFRRKHSAKDTIDMLQNTWLEWRYGWRPLIYEIKGIQKALNHQLLANGRARSRGFNRQENSGSGTFVGGDYQAECTWSRNITAESWAGVLYDYNLPQSMKYNQLLGLYDLPSAAWELTRYSFVFDWAINVGDWLRAITPTLGVTNRHCWCTTTVRDHLFYQMNKVKTPNPTFQYYGVGGGHNREVTSTTITRIKGSVPLLPPVNVKLDASKVLDLIFLIRGYGQGISNLRL